MLDPPFSCGGSIACAIHPAPVAGRRSMDLFEPLDLARIVVKREGYEL